MATTKTPSAIFLTGGAGYVGSHTVASLLENGVDSEIVVADDLSNAYVGKESHIPESLHRVEQITKKKIVFYNCNIGDKNALDSIFKKHNIRCVVHFAALKSVGESCTIPLSYYQVNVTGTCILLQVMKENGVRNLVYSSSATVYGNPQYLPMDEQHPTGQGITNPYGRSKFFCEEIMKDLCASDESWSIISLRYFNPVGAHRSGLIGEDPNGIPNNLTPFISQVAVGRRPHLDVYGNDYDTPDGTGVRDYIHIEDLAVGHAKALDMFKKKDSNGFHAINLGTGKGYSVLEVISAFEKASGEKVPYKIVSRRAGDVASSYSDAALAKRLLGWTATKGIDEMCASIWLWQSKNPFGFKQLPDKK